MSDGIVSMRLDFERILRSALGDTAIDERMTRIRARSKAYRKVVIKPSVLRMLFAAPEAPEVACARDSS